jgi:hypothetical protein
MGAAFSSETLVKNQPSYTVITQNTITLFSAVKILTLIMSLYPKGDLFATKNEREKE